jgi:hypothetical protein
MRELDIAPAQALQVVLGRQLGQACTLTPEEFRAQRARYAHVASAVEAGRREGDRVEVRLSPSLDAGVLEELIAVERECCPFFTLSYDASARILGIGVEDPRYSRALDPIAEALLPG